MSFSQIRFTLLLALVSLVAPSHTFAAEKRIVIGYVARDLNNFPVLLIKAKGFFRDAGITAELVQFRSTVALPGILGGAIDYTTAFGTSIGRAMQGAPLRGVLAMVTKPSFYLVARPEIRAVTDLKGKIIAVGSLDTVNHLIAQKVLANFGIGPEDATIMAVGDTPVRMAAVKSGAVQATMAAPPKLLKMERTVAEATYDLSLPSFSTDGSASTKGIQSIIEMSSGQAAGRQATPADVVDFGPLRDAQAALGIR